MSWTDERVEQLKKMWNEGLSAAQCAAELGGGITRNAVINKLHRMGVHERATGRKAPNKPIVPQRLPEQSYVLEQRLPPMPAERIDRDEVVIPASERVTLIELREGMCKWPIGDPQSDGFRFCGARSPAGSPYCGYHAQVAYQPKHDRRRQSAESNEKRRLAALKRGVSISRRVAR